MIMKNDRFSEIIWDEKRPFDGTIDSAEGKTVKVSLDADENEEEAARNVFNLLMENETQIRQQVAASMFVRFNDWIGDVVLTPEELAQKIALTDVMLWGIDGGQLYYEAEGDLFTDHTICVFFDADGKLDEPDLEG
jgi:hypothetical protein